MAILRAAPAVFLIVILGLALVQCTEATKRKPSKEHKRGPGIPIPKGITRDNKNWLCDGDELNETAAPECYRPHCHGAVLLEAGQALALVYQTR